MLRLPPFVYLAPRTVAEAVGMLSHHGSDVMPVAGGTDLYPNMKRRQFEPKILVGLRGLKELQGIRGSGLETRSYCYVSDVVRAMLVAAEKLDSRRLLGPLNIGSETSIRIIDLAKEVVSLSGKEIEIVLTPAETLVWGQAVDCSEARRLLDGWRPEVPLRDGLRRVYDDIAARLGEPEQQTLHGAGGRRGLPAR